MEAGIAKALRTEASAAKKALRASHGIAYLLARPIANPKVAKGLGYGVLTAPLHLAPADLSGYNVCPMATLGCKKACLHTAGNPVYMTGKTRARNAKTRAYFEARAQFLALLAQEIAVYEAKAKRAGMTCGIRLNATSDIPWERVPVTIGGVTFPNLMTLFPNVTFYDYTKRANRKGLPSNYSLTFSLAEGNDADALQALRNGHNVAAVLHVGRNRPLPAGFTIGGIVWPVIDGDLHDFRPADARGVIVGLRAKGQAIGDVSGFVRAPDGFRVAA